MDPVSATPTTPAGGTPPPAAPASATPAAAAPVATPAASGGAPATPPGAPAGAAPAAAPDPAAPASGGILDLLADDLKEIPVDPAAPVDLATKYKDDPQVQALIAEQAKFGPVAEIMKGNRYEIPSPEELKLQLEDSNTLYDIASGKKPASSLLDIMLKNPAWTPEQKNAIVSDIAQYISKLTGQPIAAAAAGAPTIEDPAMAEIKKMRAEQAAERQTAELKTFTTRVETAKTTIVGKVNELLTGTWLEGEGDYIYALLGAKFAGPEKAMELIAAAEKGDFTQIQKTLQAVKNEEALRFKARNERLIAMQKKKGATIPTQATGGSPAAPNAEPGNVVELDADKRRKQMLEQFRNPG